ncbi:MAG: hypothetical protein CME62_15405 [Halobacteriovoraceae bacterium]|nr:hypothetical protein [Halobacteriovoraceae bacterium]|tara:strand:+ start:438 stop:752 length:315 start_codon:yes stop_codon:yes gene_type:complete
MMKLVLLFSLFISSYAFALSKAEIKQSLDQMKASGMFTQEQIAEAEKQLESMDEAQIQELVKKGKEKANDPEFQKKMKALTNDPEYKAKVKKAMEQYKNQKNQE